ncbi:SRPBCC family protein [Saccharomonospora sp. NPDC006951]
MNQPLGTVTTFEGKPLLRFERTFPHPREKVWRAITDPAELAHWFPAEPDFEPFPGAPIRFGFPAGGDQSAFGHGEVVEFDRPKVFAFRWADSMLRFELLPGEDGCTLVFTHLLNGTDTSGDLPSIARQAPGWDGCLGRLGCLLSGEDLPAVSGEWFLERAEEYIERFGLARGSVERHEHGRLIRFERDLVASTSDVWTLLTGDEELRPGAEPPVAFTHGYQRVGAITEVVASRVLEYAVPEDSPEPGRVRFELRDQLPIGTRLVLSQYISPHERSRPRHTARGMADTSRIAVRCPGRRRSLPVALRAHRSVARALRARRTLTPEAGMRSSRRVLVTAIVSA